MTDIDIAIAFAFGFPLLSIVIIGLAWYIEKKVVLRRKPH